MKVPRVGFGTAALGDKAKASIKTALDYGNYSLLQVIAP
jgi:diketogulonate reductase-like aldo/keto reductase